MSALHGLTLLRYGHVYGGGGGMEQYLQDLNRVLLERNNFRTIQVQMTSNADAAVRETEEAMGQGRLLTSSLFVDENAHAQSIRDAGPERGVRQQFKDWVRDRILMAPGVYPYVTRPLLSRRRMPRRCGEPPGAGEAVRRWHKRYPINLVCLHSAAGSDTQEVIAFARKERIPVAYIHHFSNDRLGGLTMRGQIEGLGGVAGVCGLEVPAYLKGRLFNVSDGVDTEFFRREKARPLGRTFVGPVLFLHDTR